MQFDYKLLINNFFPVRLRGPDELTKATAKFTSDLQTFSNGVKLC